MKASAPIEEHDVIIAVRDFFSCILVSVWRLMAFDFVGGLELDFGFGIWLLASMYLAPNIHYILSK